MGFFSDLLTIAAPIIGATLGGPVGASAGVALAGFVAGDKPMAAITGDVSGLSPAAQARVRAGTVKPGVSLTREQAIARERAGTGRARKRTTVETIDPVTGMVLRTETFAGGVAVRAADVAAANRVFRQINRLGRKLPKKLVKQSERARLTEELTEAALRRARDGADCPPKCP